MYYAAETDRDKALELVRTLLGETAFKIEACRPLPVVINGVSLPEGAVKELYRREIVPGPVKLPDL
jgi:hypothetical protein